MEPLALNYAKLIVKGLRTLESIPPRLKKLTEQKVAELSGMALTGKVADPIQVKTKIQVPADAPHVDPSRADAQVTTDGSVETSESGQADN